MLRLAILEKGTKGLDNFHLVIPKVLKQIVLESARGVGRQGRDRMLSIVTPRHLWAGITRDVGTLCQDCHGCDVDKLPPSVPLQVG